MLKISALAFLSATLVVACSAPDGGTTSRTDGLTSPAPSSSPGNGPGPGCGGWSCSVATRLVTDKDMFDLLTRNGGFDGGSPDLARVAALRCVGVPDACQPASCFVKTMCGGGGSLSGEDSLIASSWIDARNPQTVSTEDAGFAQRKSLFGLECTRNAHQTVCAYAPPTPPNGSSSGSSGPIPPTGSSSGGAD